MTVLWLYKKITLFFGTCKLKDLGAKGHNLANYSQMVQKKIFIYYFMKSDCGKKLTFGESGVKKRIGEFFELFLQLFCKSEIISIF